MGIEEARRILFFVSPDEENVAGLRRALKMLYGDDYSLDILSRLGEAFRFEDLESEVVLVDGVRVRVATPRMLYKMKKDTVRPQDKVDAQALRERFGLPE